MFDDSKYIHKSDNISLKFDIQKYIDVGISSNFDTDYEFGIKDAIPMSLNVESFILIKTSCMHNIHHLFQLPVKTEIKWKIKGGTENGAFKIGSGMDAEFFARDCGDSVIFYPQLQNIGKNTIHKKIYIELTIKPIESSLVEQDEYKFIVHVNILIIRRFLKTNYRVKMFLSRMDNNNDNNNNLDNNILNSDIIEYLNDIKNTTKIEQEGNQLLFKSLNSCKICNLSVIVNLNKYSFSDKIF